MLIACKCLNLIAISGDNDSGASNLTKNQLKRDLSDYNSLRVIIGASSGGGGARNNDNNTNNDHDLDEIKFGINLADLRNVKDPHNIYSMCIEFLRQAIGPINDLTETIAQTSMIYKVPIGQWSLYYCINCKYVTHAKHTSNGRYLINSRLLTNHEEINSLKDKERFSKIFGLIIMNKQMEMQMQMQMTRNLTPPKTTNDKQKNIVVNNDNDDNVNNKHRAEIERLTQHLNNQCQREIFETDERIHSYIEQQFALLKQYREKAEYEYQILVSLVNNVPDELKMIETVNNLDATQEATDLNATTDDNLKSLFTIKHQQVPSLDTPPATPDSTPMSIGNSPTFRNQTNIFSGGARNQQQYHLNSGPKTLDGDCLFELEEDMETYPISTSNAMSDLEEADDAEDALGELGMGIHIPKSHKQKQSLILARSLPITIAPAAEARFVPDEAEDELSDDNNVDIAASIKALAMSVHGVTVFGDLPRPRFSTQI